MPSAGSSFAQSCPHCGCPIAPVAVEKKPDLRVDPQTPHVTTERTAKELKSQQLGAGCLVLVGVVFLMIGGAATRGSGGEPAVALFGGISALVGAIWWIVVRFRIWWHHDQAHLEGS